MILVTQGQRRGWGPRRRNRQSRPILPKPLFKYFSQAVNTLSRRRHDRQVGHAGHNKSYARGLCTKTHDARRMISSIGMSEGDVGVCVCRLRGGVGTLSSPALGMIASVTSAARTSALFPSETYTSRRERSTASTCRAGRNDVCVVCEVCPGVPVIRRLMDAAVYFRPSFPADLGHPQHVSGLFQD